jgi:anti-sigma factor RsiW
MDACTPFRKLLSLDMDGEIDEAGRERLLAHLEGCAACRSEKALWLRIRALIPVPEDVPGDGIALRVLDGIRRRRLEAERALPLIRRLAAAAAVVIVAAVGLLVVLPEREGGGSVAPSARRDLGRTLIIDHTSGPAPGLALDEGSD